LLLFSKDDRLSALGKEWPEIRTIARPAVKTIPDSHLLVTVNCIKLHKISFYCPIYKIVQYIIPTPIIFIDFKNKDTMVRDAQKDIFVLVMKHILIYCIVVSYSSTISN